MVCGWTSRRLFPPNVSLPNRNCGKKTSLAEGPGKKLHELLGEYGITPTSDCKCQKRMRLMNTWGVDGCEERKAEIIEWLVDATVGLAVISWLPVWTKRAAAEWLLDEAIRRTKNQSQEHVSSP